MKYIFIALLTIFFFPSISRSQNYKKVNLNKVKKALEHVKYTYGPDSSVMHRGIEMEYYLETLEFKFEEILLNDSRDTLLMKGRIKSSDVNYHLSPISASIWTCDLLSNKDLRLNKKIYTTDSKGNFDFRLAVNGVEKIYFLYNNPKAPILPGALNIRSLLD